MRIPHVSRPNEEFDSNVIVGLYSEQLDRSSVPRRFVVGLDFGTTTTAVSYYAHPVDEPTPRVFADDVKSIMNWPNDDTNEYMSGLMKQGEKIGESDFSF
jgi:hypothetical protein